MTIYYDPASPEQTESLASSQPQFRQNFTAIFEKFLVNHRELNIPSQGQHDVIQLLQQENGIQTNINELNIYSKKVEDQTTQLFLRSQGNGQEVQITNYQLYSLNDLQFFTTLPGGFIVYFGILPSMPTGSQFTVTPTPKSIVSSSFCPNGIANIKSFPPFVYYSDSNKKTGYIDTVTFITPSDKTNTIFSQFYFIVGNFA